MTNGGLSLMKRTQRWKLKGLAVCAAAVAFGVAIPSGAAAAPGTPGPGTTPSVEPAPAQPSPPGPGNVTDSAPGLRAQARPGDFASSFEPADRPLTWVSTAETDAKGNKRMHGVTGNSAVGTPGNIMGKAPEAPASAENPPSETKERLIDGNVNTKWLSFAPSGWVQVKLSEPIKVVDYAVASANDAPGRDPTDWALQGSADGQTWTDLDVRTGQKFDTRFQTKLYKVANTTAYLYYRLNMTATAGDPLIQLAEWQLSNGDTSPPPPADMKSFVTGGPIDGPNMKPNAGFTGLKSLQYSGSQTVKDRGYAYNKLYDVDIPVGPDPELSYLIFPEFTAASLAYPSTYAAVDL